MRFSRWLSGVALTALAAFTTANAAHAEQQTSWSGAPKWTDTDTGFEFKVRGRLHYDVISGDSDLDDGTGERYQRSTVRRAHLGVEGKFAPKWRYRAEFVLNPSTATSVASTPATVSESEVGVDDFYLEWVGKKYSIILGEQNITNPLEERTSSNTIQFNERSSVINAFGYARAAGLAFITNGANWSVAAGLYGDSLNNADSAAAEEPHFVSARATWAPIMEKSPEGTHLLHLGVSMRYRDNGEESIASSYGARPLNGRYGATYISGGIPGGGADNDFTYGLEVAGQFGPFGVQSEYLHIKAEGTDALSTEAEASGGYVDLFWSITGEDRNYSGATGSFGRITPRKAFGEGGPGAWILGLRYDYLDVSDTAFTGANRGEQTALLGGVQWNPISQVTFKLNYAQTDFDREVGVDGEAKVISFRSQYDW